MDKNLEALLDAARAATQASYEDLHDANLQFRKLARPATILALVERVAAMEWSNEPPKIAGWYWYTDGTFVSIEDVRPRPGHDYLAIAAPMEMLGASGKRDFIPVVRIRGQWAGPITPPTGADHG